MATQKESKTISLAEKLILRWYIVKHAGTRIYLVKQLVLVSALNTVVKK